jgi:hypothetical protein
MSTATSHTSTALNGLAATLRRELEVARAEVRTLAARRAEADRVARAAIEAENSARRALAALEAVAREAAGVLPDLGQGPSADEPHSDLRRLAGAKLREMIARVALRQRAVGRSAHWSEWHAWLRDAGFEAAGKKPEATFQTQLTRSPLVRRAAHEGIYVLDLDRFQAERALLNRLHHQLSQLPPPDQLALLGDHREQRRQIQNDIARAERAIEEMWRVLAHEAPPGWPENVDLRPERAVGAWLQLIEDPRSS